MGAKEWRREKLQTLDVQDFDGKVSEVIAYFQALESEWVAKGYRSVTVEADAYYDYTSIDIYGERLETDKELEARLKRSKKAQEAAKARKEKQEKSDRALLKKLKAKYDG